ncbi:hypothetical protein EMIHUDRAFT_218793 [Emiliania huxleyi CCMP1516]|uniref:UBA domain-containing protein n=2 Tax=Emiliania huxleyi TaxID=2903 RepID=A0A0D3I664_EMIH1|nr:hypothetical protein EMIHUDRAFT_218793 [Emiliania huxleyi CCMP1516]EOD06749.1 hypothetical protein EMIHUDRAFT_218793 [Emiliania huxleyi CCMP1516]|eukprot:XP_005759178.1 hypothetical protein EMIHUDRAFT_218793 [Emiliania huxleyi CCMP1516]
MAGVNDELTRKLAARGIGRGNLVDGVKDGLADGSILVQKRNEMDRDHSPNTGASPKASPVAARSKRKGLLGGIRNRSKTG